MSSACFSNPSAWISSLRASKPPACLACSRSVLAWSSSGLALRSAASSRASGRVSAPSRIAAAALRGRSAKRSRLGAVGLGLTVRRFLERLGTLVRGLANRGDLTLLRRLRLGTSGEQAEGGERKEGADG